MSQELPDKPISGSSVGSIQSNPSADSEKDRKTFLIAMYSQMWKNIDTHILVVWQSVGAVLGSLAIFGLVQKEFISVDLAISLIILLSGWLIAHVYDAWEWFHRNLVILTNIERQFLFGDDLKVIHPFFGSQRPPHHMLRHLRIQWCLGLVLSIAMLLYHFVLRVLPGFWSPWNTFDPIRTLPYVIAVTVAILLVLIRNTVLKENQNLSEGATGKAIAQKHSHSET